MSASDSTINTALSVPATTKSKRLCFCSAIVGFNTNWLSIKPTRAAPIGPLKGTPDKVNAAEAPIIATKSGLICGFTETTVATTWISLKKPSGNNGRIGRSIKRAINVSPSDGRPSRLKKPPGILPAA